MKTCQPPLLRSALFAVTLFASPSLATAGTGDPLPGAPSSTSKIPPLEVTGVVSKLKAQLYGYIKADAAYTSSAVDNGDFARRVLAGGEDDGQFHITARQTRIGLNFEGPSTESLRTTGKVELDFFGGGASNSSMPRTRHAFVNVDWPAEDFSLLAGQTSDVISPLVPTTLNYTVAWWTGDQGFRHNQVRATKGMDLGDDMRLLFQLAAVRSPGGEDAGRPGYQGRVAYSFPGIDGNQTTLGISAHDSREAMGADSNSINVDLTLPITDDAKILAEFFSGENLDGFAGTFDGVNAAGEEIDATGFWAGINIKGAARWSYNLGFGIQSPDDDDLDAGMVETNQNYWANAIYSLDDATTVGLELQRLETEYLGGDDESALRVQAAVTFSF